MLCQSQKTWENCSYDTAMAVLRRHSRSPSPRTVRPSLLTNGCRGANHRVPCASCSAGEGHAGPGAPTDRSYRNPGAYEQPTRFLEERQPLRDNGKEAMVTLNTLRHEKRVEILRLANVHGCRNVRVFGSVAMQENRPDSDAHRVMDE